MRRRFPPTRRSIAARRLAAAAIFALLALPWSSGCGGGAAPAVAPPDDTPTADGVAADVPATSRDVVQPADTATPDDGAGGRDLARPDDGSDARPDDGSDARPDDDGDARPRDDGDARPRDGGSETSPADTLDGGDAAGGPCLDPAPLPAWATVVEDESGPRLVVQTARQAVHLAPLADGTVRVTCTAPGDEPPARSWALVARPAPAPDAVFGDRGGRAAVCTGAWRATVDRDGLVRVEDAAGRLLVEDAAACLAGPDGATITRVAPQDEAYYGFGEKTGPLNKRGRRMVFWNTDPYDPAWGGYAPDADPIYQSIPFFVGLRDGRAYGVFTDDPRRLEMDVAAAAPGVVTIASPGPSLDQYVFVGPALADVVRRYTALTGRPPLPAAWTLGLHQSRWGYDAAQARAVAARYRDEGIPADGLWLDIQHMRGFRTFTWDPVDHPDPAAFVADLAALHFRTIVIADPCLAEDPAWDIYAAAVAGDHLLGRPDGGIYVGSAWPGACAFPDFTAARTRDWWADLVERPLAVGVAGIWLDVNEPTTFDQPTVSNAVPVDGDGDPQTMAEAHNVYALNEAKATWEGFRRAAPDRRPFLLSRAGYAGIQRYAAVWTGDVPSTWHGLAESLPMMLNLGLSGVPFVGSDVGGYAGGASPELFARWMELGAASPFLRVHTTRDAPDQEPWQFGTEVRDLSRIVTTWRYGLLPYLYSLFAEANRTGAPVLRPLVWSFPDDPAARDRGDHALLGPWLLLAPVLTEGATTRAIHLPPGRWFEFASGAVRDGGDFETGVTLAALPIWVREGAIVPRRDPQSWIDGSLPDPLYLDVYPARSASTFTLYEDDGDGFAHEDQARFAATTFRLVGDGDGATLEASREGALPLPDRWLVVRVRRVDAAPTGVTFDGEALAERASREALFGTDDGGGGGDGWWWDERDRSLVVRVADRGAYTLAMAYDPTVATPRPDVLVHLVARVPEGTPRDAPVHVATSANGWTHQPLAWGPGPDEAEGDVLVPRGEWFEYKYTRGGWETVEKWPGCEEATNRYSLGAAHPSKYDTVYAWRDWCP